MRKVCRVCWVGHSHGFGFREGAFAKWYCETPSNYVDYVTMRFRKHSEIFQHLIDQNLFIYQSEKRKN